MESTLISFNDKVNIKNGTKEKVSIKKVLKESVAIILLLTIISLRLYIFVCDCADFYFLKRLC